MFAGVGDLPCCDADYDVLEHYELFKMLAVDKVYESDILVSEPHSTNEIFGSKC